MSALPVSHLQRTRPSFKVSCTADGEHSWLALKAKLSRITKLHVLGNPHSGIFLRKNNTRLIFFSLLQPRWLLLKAGQNRDTRHESAGENVLYWSEAVRRFPADYDTNQEEM